MCGRFANALQAQAYRNAVQAQIQGMRNRNRRGNPDDNQQGGGGEEGQDGFDFHHGPNIDAYRPSHNVAPQTRSPILRFDNDKGELILDTMKWGLVHRAAKLPPTGLDAARSINARDDTILRASIWSPLFPKQRAILFVQGFYEWQHKEKIGSKDEIIAHFIGLDQGGMGRIDKNGKEKALLPMACLWEKCRFNRDEQDTYTFTIVTTAANKQMHFHQRMPVILPDQESIALWLGLPSTGSQDLNNVAKLMKPFEKNLEVYPCPREVGKVGTDNPAYILPIGQRKDGIMAAFGRAKSNKSSIGAGGSNEKIGTLEKDDKVEDQVALSNLADESIKEQDRVSQDEKERSNSQENTSKFQEGEQPQEAEEEKEIKPKPSSKFSPEPWNPPLSTPPGGKSSYSTPKKSTPSTKGKGKVKDEVQEAKGKASLESAFKRQEKRKRDEVEFKKEAGLDDDEVIEIEDGKKRDDVGEKQSGLAGKSDEDSTEKGKGKKKMKKEDSASPKKGNQDIRSFFK